MIKVKIYISFFIPPQNLTDADLNEMIAEIDEDGSGWVDYDEFKGLMLG